MHVSSNHSQSSSFHNAFVFHLTLNLANCGNTYLYAGVQSCCISRGQEVRNSNSGGIIVFHSWVGYSLSVTGF